MSALPAVSATELAAELAGPNPPLVLDVRQAEELEIASLPGALHIPLNELPSRLGEIPRDRPIVAMCHHGMRSARATAWLLTQGITSIRNFTGGIESWANDIDPAMMRY